MLRFFQVNASIYKPDKPVIIGEFSQKKGGLKTSPEQFTWAYYHGYSGAWSWCALDNGRVVFSWSNDRFYMLMLSLSRRYKNNCLYTCVMGNFHIKTK